MSIRYDQFCALSRAAEVLSERWTPLIIRELLLGPRRFTDLKERLGGVSASVLAERLGYLEESGVVRRSYLEPPAASNVYELTDHGRDLEPTVSEMIRWGAARMLPQRPTDRFLGDWVYLALNACKRTTPTATVSFQLLIDADRIFAVHVAGSVEGTTVRQGTYDAALTIVSDGPALLGLMSGASPPDSLVEAGRISLAGDITLITVFPGLFNLHPVAEGAKHG